MASFPTRRTPKAPLHPPYRAAPASPSYAYPSHVMESESPSRKRNWTSGTSSLAALSRPYAAPSGEFYAGAAPQGSYFEQQQHQLQQQHASSSGAGGAYETLARAQEAAQAAQARERQQSANTLASNEETRQGPPNKRRKGVAGAIVEGALSTALYAGAAAITAYSLWSSWGRRPEEDAAAEPRPGEKRMAPEEPPPPPYPDEMPEAPLSPGSSSAASGSRHIPRHVYVSQRRRRPAIPSHRSSHRTPQRARGGSVAPVTPAAPSSDNGMSDDAGHGSDDEGFSRLNAQMAAMIAEGQAALSAQVEIGPDEALYAPTPSRYGAVAAQRRFDDQYAEPPSLRTMRSPSQIDFSFATHGESSSPFLGSGADGVRYDAGGFGAQDTYTSPFVFGAGSSSTAVGAGSASDSGAATPQAARFQHGTEVDTSSYATPHFDQMRPNQSYHDSPSEHAHRRPRWR